MQACERGRGCLFCLTSGMAQAASIEEIAFYPVPWVRLDQSDAANVGIFSRWTNRAYVQGISVVR
eukprot:228750-Prorocentrum_minimum.AAC.1